MDKKINVNMEEHAERVYWYIRFNIPLNPESVSDKTMNVTDTEGYIMKTEITYNKGADRICISPRDSYQQDRFYLLNITRKVKPEKGTDLKTEIHILFKLLRDQISEFRVLGNNVTVPAVKPRPKDYEIKNPGTKVYVFDNGKSEDLLGDKMEYADLKLNPWGGLGGFAAAAGSVLTGNSIVMIGGAVLFIAGMAHIIIQFAGKGMQSRMSYNRGVGKFNAGKYAGAKKHFEHAALIDEKFEEAEHGLNKVNYYL